MRNGRQALLRTDFDTRFGIETKANRDFFPDLLDSGALLLRHRYQNADMSSPSNQPELITHLPHAWIRRNGQQITTLDLFGDSYVLLAGPKATVLASSHPYLNPGTPAVYVVDRDFEFVDAEDNWRTLTSLSDDGVVTVGQMDLSCFARFRAEGFEQLSRSAATRLRSMPMATPWPIGWPTAKKSTPEPGGTTRPVHTAAHRVA